MRPLVATRGSGLLEPWLSRQRARRANRLIRASLRAGRILDIGCGASPYFLATTVFREKFSLDRLPMAPELQRMRRVQHVVHDLATCARLPFADATFSVITMLAVLEHVEPEVARRILRDCHRALAPGGIVIVTTPAAWADGLLRAMARLGLVSAEEIREHACAYSLRTLRLVMTEAGFLPPHKLRAGPFELGLNLWAVGEK